MFKYLSEFVAELHAREKRQCRIVIVTSKISLAEKIFSDLNEFKEFDFIKYNDFQGIINHDQVIVQINSLHRLNRYFTPDVLLIDEAKDFCTYICSGHFCEEFVTQASYAQLERLICISQKIFLMDADLD
jgi:hypothetical protein